MNDGYRKDRRYNYVGKVEDLVLKKDANGTNMVTFNLARAGSAPFPCVGFGDRADMVAQSLHDGAEAKVFGFYDKRDVPQPGTNETRRTQRFKLLWAGKHRRGN